LLQLHLLLFCEALLKLCAEHAADFPPKCHAPVRLVTEFCGK